MQAQNKINSYEYWFDNDFVSKVTTNITPVANYNLSSSIPTSGLASGLHVFNVRFKDDSSRYSQVSSSFFFKQYQGVGQLQNEITQYEYWIDNDYASKTSVSISATQSFNLNGNITTSSTVPGLHVFNIRFRDSGGKWSQVLSQFFYKSTPTNSAQNDIVEYEFWYDNDYLTKVNVPVSPQQNFNLMTNLATSSLPIGLHVMNIRFKDVTGKWSQVLSHFFNKTQASQSNQKLLTTYQYWYDNDFANHVTQSITPVSNYQLLSSISTGTLPTGLHTFNVRFKDTNNLWSQVLTQFIYKSEPIPTGNNVIVAYRYWADDNIASATYVQLPTPVTNFNLNTTINMLNVPKGARTFNIQFKDTINKWSVVQTDSFFRTPKPFASFAAGTTAFCDSGTVSFANNSFDTDIYLWDFGDGFTSTDSAPVHTYTTPGNYTVSLLATDTLMYLQDDTIQSAYITVNVLPTVTATVSDDTLCAGQSTTFIASGNASNYTWSNGIVNNQAFTPSNSLMYTLTGSNGICSNMDSIYVTVNPLPNVVVANVSPSNVVCNGNSVTASGGGATSYTWSGPQSISNSVPFIASQSGTYVVTGTDANLCSNTASFALNVLALPNVAVASILPNDSICHGTSVTMSGAGATVYAWNGPQTITDGNPFNATTTGVYTLTGVDANGCSNSTSASLTVHDLPSVGIGTLQPNDTICNGTQVFIAATGFGAVSFSYSGPQAVSNATPFTATTTGTYTITASSMFNCTSTLTQHIEVNPLPIVAVSTINPNDTVCDGTTLTLAGSGASNYSWNGPQSISDNTAFTATSSGVYTVTGTDANLCSNTSSVAITINPIPVFSLGVDTSICQGTQLTLSQPYVGATTLWSDNSNADTLNVNTLGTYSCSVTLDGCIYVDTIEVGIDSLPVANFGYLISNSEIDLTDSSKFSTAYKWYFGDGDSSVIANPTHIYSSNGNYTVTQIVYNECGSDTFTVNARIITGIADNQINDDVLIYPNPAYNQFYIDLKNLDKEQVSLFLIDLKGELLLKENYVNASKIIKFDITSLSAGTYLLRIVARNQSFVQRVTITK